MYGTMLQDAFQLVTLMVLLKSQCTSEHFQVLRPLNAHVQSCLQIYNKDNNYTLWIISNYACY